MTGTLGRNPEAPELGPTSDQFGLAVLLEKTPTSVPTKIVPLAESTRTEFAGASGKAPVPVPLKSAQDAPALVVCQTCGVPKPMIVTYAV